MAKPAYIELGERRHAVQIPILFEDRSVLAIDKPAGWMLVPFSWQRTGRNLQAAITSSIAAGDFWARSRNLKFLRNVHRLDADTSGVLLMARSPGAVENFSDLFESRRMDKTYLAVVHGVPRQTEWTCVEPLAPDPDHHGSMRMDPDGKEAETGFRVLQSRNKLSLIEAKPLTGRTHQIRLHLRAAGLSIVGDELYGDAAADRASKWPQEKFPLALRAVSLAYRDPFTQRPVRINAPREEFVRAFGFNPGTTGAPGPAQAEPAPPRNRLAPPGQPGKLPA